MKVKSEGEVAQSCPTLSDPMNCSLPGSSVHGIFQARVLEWGAITFSVWTLTMCFSLSCKPNPWSMSHPLLPLRMRKMEINSSSHQSLDSTIFYTREGDEVFYAVWPGRLLENHLRAKQDNLLHFIGYVSKRSHPEEFWVKRRKQVFSQELINWGIFSTISGFFFQILYLIPRKLKHMLSKTCQRCQLIQNEWLNLKELTRQGPF